jgi:hypothetical protein
MCAMHPGEVATIPGTCRICRMALVDASTLNLPPYVVELSTSPDRVTANVPFTLRLSVREPGGGAITSRFDLVHEMWYHLFIVNDDMTVYQHLHPAPQPDQSWAIEVTLPADGQYSVLSDFVPTGASPQFLRNTLETDRSDSVAEGRRSLGLQRAPQTAGDVTASLTFAPSAVTTGQVTRMTYRLTDTVTGEPALDLQPYLGAFGHTLVVREGVSAWVHSHPTDDGGRILTSRSRGGPEVSFDAWFARPGRYRAWTQFMRGGEIRTVSFTFDVVPPR